MKLIKIKSLIYNYILKFLINQLKKFHIYHKVMKIYLKYFDMMK